MDPKKILMVADSINMGGVGTHIFTLSEILVQKKIDIVLVLFSNNKHLEDEFLKIGARCYLLPIPSVKSRSKQIFYIFSLLLRAPFLSISLLRIVRKERVDIIHSHVSSVFSSGIACIISKVCRVPIVYTVHNKIRRFPELFRYITKNCGGLLTISPELMDYLSQSLGIKENMYVIPNAIDINKYHPLQNNEFDGKKNRIVHITRMDDEKINATLKLIEAAPEIFAAYPDTEIVIIGGGKNYECVHNMVEGINKKTGGDGITMMGVVAPAVLLHLLNTADVVVGVGRVAIEAMACGKPVVIAGSQGLSGVLTEENKAKMKYYNFSGRDAQSGYTPDQLAAEIIKLFRDSNYYGSTKTLGLKIVKEELNIERIAEQIEELYIQAINKNRHITS